MMMCKKCEEWCRKKEGVSWVAICAHCGETFIRRGDFWKSKKTGKTIPVERNREVNKVLFPEYRGFA